VILLLHLALALVSPVVAPKSPTAMDPDAAFSPPSTEHFFGTDRYGRDVFTRTLLGGRIALALALVSAFLAVLLGGLIGVSLAYVGGMIDEAAMRIVDAYISIPGLLLLLVIVTTLGSGYSTLVFPWCFPTRPVSSVWRARRRRNLSRATSLRQRVPAASASSPL
jgi:peptide/nickel transport system permease protein